ncbi:MAG: YCF48-related protein [Bacteroidetes bacterium]|nr:YCF48-related protein [Bacteroidota bacterium]
MIRFLLSFSLLFLFIQSKAQVTTVNIDIPDLLVATQYFFDENKGFVIGKSVYDPQTSTSLKTSIRRTTDGGISFVEGGNGDQFFDGSSFNNITFIDSQKGFMVGSYSFALWKAGAMIYSTSNGGLTWSITEYIGEGHSFLSIDFPTYSVGYICGYEGDIYKSTNSGSSWSKMPSPTTLALVDVKFKDELHGVVVGLGGTLYKTSDGGSSWQDISFGSRDNYSVVLKNDSIIVASEDGIFMSFDGGSNWHVAVKYKSYQVADLVINQNTGEIWAAGGSKVYRSSTGEFWEYTDVPGIATSISLVPQKNIAYVSDFHGKLYKIQDLSMKMVPVTRFEMTKSNYCAYDKIELSNFSPKGGSYKWYYDNVLVATDYSPTIYADTMGGDKSLRLTCNNDTYESSYNMPFYVMPIPKIKDITVNVANDTFCFGNSLTLDLSALETIVTYQVLIDGSPYHSSFTNVTSKTFTIPNLQGEPKVQVKALKSTSCDTVIKIFNTSTPIKVYALPALNYSFSYDSLVCLKDTVHFSGSNLSAAYDYQFKAMGGAYTFFSELNGKSFNYFFKEGQHSDAFYIEVKDKTSGCLSKSKTYAVKVDSAVSRFSFKQSFYLVGDSAEVVNTSNAVNFVWTTNDGLSSHVKNPKFSFSSTGIKSLKLFCTSGIGCKDSITKNITITDPQVFDPSKQCDSMSIAPSPYYKQVEMDYTVDQFGNRYVVYDLIVSGPSTYCSFFKYDKTGKIVAQGHLSPEYGTGKVAHYTGIDADNMGNMYVSGTFNTDQYTTGGVSKTVATEEKHGFLIKYDANGKFKWIIYSQIERGYLNMVGATATDVKVLNDNRIFVAMKGSFNSIVSANKYVTPHGNVLHGNADSHINILEVDSTGKIVMNHKAFEITPSVFYPNFGGSYNIDPQSITTNPFVVPKMKLNKKTNTITITGSFIKSVQFGSTVLTAATNTVGHYIATLNVDLSWQNAFVLYSMVGPGYNGYSDTYIDRQDFPSWDVDDDGNIYYNIDWNNIFTSGSAGVSTKLVFDGKEISAISKNILVKFSPSGKIIWYNENEFYHSAFIANYKNKLFVGGTFNTIYNSTNTPVVKTSDGKSFGFPASGRADCFIMEVDTSGKYQWSKTVSSKDYDWIFDAAASPCGQLSYLIEKNSVHSIYDLDDNGNCGSTCAFFNKTANAINSCTGKSLDMKISSYGLDSASVYLSYYGSTNFYKKIAYHGSWNVKLPDTISAPFIKVIFSALSKSDTIKVNLFSSPTLNLPDTAISCSPLSYAFVKGPVGYTTYDWSGTNFSSTSDNLITTTPGFYSLTVTKGNSCSATDKMYLIMSDYSSKNMEVSTSDSILYNFKYLDSLKVKFAEWDFGDGTPHLKGSYKTAHTYKDSGEYILKLKVGNLCDTVEIVNTLKVKAKNKVGLREDLTTLNSMRLYPNPFQEEFAFIMNGNENMTLKITNVIGQELRTCQTTGNVKINVADFADGIYYLSVYSNNSLIKTEKILKRN